ncbi:hypothetical protein PGQ11_000282 [Apiospora arundinis]
MNNATSLPVPEPRNGTRPPTKWDIGKLSRKLRGRWIHPQTNFYLQALVDGPIFIIIGVVLYESVVAIQLAAAPSDVYHEGLFSLLARSAWVATVFAVATGFSMGSFYDALKRWKLEEVTEPKASDPEQATTYPAPCRVVKYVTIGRLRMPYWLYMTSTLILALGLPAFASIAVREISSCWAGYHTQFGQNQAVSPHYFFQHSMASFIGAVLFCLFDVVAIVARLIIVMRYLPRLEPTTQGNVGEKWETAHGAARLA